MSELKPSVLSMLEIGQDCGLTTLGEAYDNYMNHYDCFFLISKYKEQYAEFVATLQSFGFVDDGGLIDIRIPEAITIVTKAGGN